MQVLTRRLLTRVWFACALLLPRIASAEVFFERQNTFDETGRRHALLMVLGHIHPGEEVVFARALRTIGSEKLRLVEDSVILNSWGGNRWAAFDMGRLVRKKRLATLVPSGAQCDSACVWVLVAGLDRVLPLSTTRKLRPWAIGAPLEDYALGDPRCTRASLLRARSSADPALEMGASYFSRAKI